MNLLEIKVAFCLLFFAGCVVFYIFDLRVENKSLKLQLSAKNEQILIQHEQDIAWQHERDNIAGYYGEQYQENNSAILSQPFPKDEDCVAVIAYQRGEILKWVARH